MATFYLNHESELYHHGILGMHWGIRRYQNKDGSLTPAGRKRYNPYGYDVDKYNSDKYEKYHESKGISVDDTYYRNKETGELETVRRDKKGVYTYAGKSSFDPKNQQKPPTYSEKGARNSASELSKSGLKVTGIREGKYGTAVIGVKSSIPGVATSVTHSEGHKPGYEKKAASFFKNARKEDAARRAELSGAKDYGNGYGDPYKQYREFIKKQNGIFNRQKPLSRKEFSKLAKLDEMLYSSHDNGKGMNYTIPGFVLEYYSAPGYAASGWKVRRGG